MYQAGVRNLDLTFIVKEVAWPVILSLSLCIAVPYVTFMGAMSALGIYIIICISLGGGRSLIPYCGKLSREKTFANQQKENLRGTV